MEACGKLVATVNYVYVCFLKREREKNKDKEK